MRPAANAELLRPRPLNPPQLLKLTILMTWSAWCIGVNHSPTWVTVISVASPAKTGDDRDNGHAPVRMEDDRDKGRVRDGSMVVGAKGVQRVTRGLRTMVVVGGQGGQGGRGVRDDALGDGAP
jgi:hypothetical protein